MPRSRRMLFGAAMLAVGLQCAAASSLHYNSNNNNNIINNGAMELVEEAGGAGGAALRARRAAEHSTATRSWESAAGGGAGWSTMMASVAVVLAAAMFSVGLLCCSKPKPMEAQLNEPVNLSGRRKRFSYVGIEDESKGMARLNSKASLEVSMSAGFMGSNDGAADGAGYDFGRGASVRSANTDGYIDVGMDDDGGGGGGGGGGGAWHIPLDSTTQVVVGADGSTASSPNKMARRQSATQAFGSFAALAQQQRFIIPFDDGPGMAAPTGMASSSRKNPLFDAGAMGAIFGDAHTGSSTPDPFGDDESVRSGVESDSDFKGFELSEDGPPTAVTATEDEIFDGFGDAEDEEADGFGGLDMSQDMGGRSTPRTGSILKPGSITSPLKEIDVSEETEIEVSDDDAFAMEELCDWLNQIRSMTTAEIVDTLTKMMKLLQKPGLVAECVDMNGVVSLISILKEFSEPKVQQPTMEVLEIICTTKKGSVELFENQAANILVFALESEDVWMESLAVITQALASAPVYVTPLLHNETFYIQLSDRLALAKNAKTLEQLFKCVITTCDLIEDPSDLGPIFTSTAMVIKRKPSEPVCTIITKMIGYAVATHGPVALGEAASSGLSDAIEASKNKKLMAAYKAIEEENSFE